VRVAFDLTVAGRARTGVGVYARNLAAHLGHPSLEIVPWRHRLGPEGTGPLRLLAAVRLTSWLQLHVPRAIRRDRITVYHSPCSLGPLRTPCARVMTVHDAIMLAMPSQYGAVERVYFRLFSVVAARRADAVIVPSHAARADVARVYGIPPARLSVIPEAASPRFRPIAPAERAPVLARYGIRPPYVLFVGAIVPRKNLPRLLDAFAASRRRVGRDASLVLVGPPESSVGPIRHPHLDGHLHRLDRVPDDDLPALYSGAACLAYPSLAEGFGLPILEAMACGTPVMTSNCSAMAEVAGDAALLVDPRRTEAIAEGLVRLLAERGLGEALGERGLARARAFTWEQAARATEEVYRAAADRAGAVPGPAAPARGGDALAAGAGRPRAAGPSASASGVPSPR
jgi:glycosyltransferase involved in cell wall biosynthesis